MKLNNEDIKLYTKIPKDLAAKLQPLILEAVEASGLERNLVQSALLKELEGTSARIGVATAKRLLKDPAGLVNGYLQAVAVEKARKQGNFDQNLKLMVARVSESFPEDTYQELKARFPTCRDYQQLQAAAALHVQNGGHPLTVVPLADWATNKRPLPAQVVSRLVGENLVLIDGEAVGFKDGSVVGPLPKKDLAVAEGMRVVAAPECPQIDFALA